MESSKQNTLAKKLCQLCKPGNPLILANVYDAATASIVAAHPATKAIATASFAFAATRGKADADLTFEDNLAASRVIAAVVSKTDLPLTVDIQDGYENVEDCVREMIQLGAVGCNIEDLSSTTGKLHGTDEMAARIKLVKKIAASAGVPDFCVNARTDVLIFGCSVDEAIERGRAYLAAGATTVYVWGGSSGRGVSKQEVQSLVEGLGGMINVKMNLRTGFLNAQELSELGVARISVGPELYHKAMKGFSEAFEAMAK